MQFNEILSIYTDVFLLAHNVGGMASKGFRAISYQVTQKVEAGYNPSHTTETLIGYTACCAFVILFSTI